jgi:copper(I)-binding protein
MSSPVRTAKRRLWSLGLCGAALMLWATSAQAHYEDYAAVAISHPYLVPERSSVRLLLRIENRTAKDLVLSGIAGPSGQRAQLRARLDDHRYATLQSITIPAEEEINLDSSHLLILFEDRINADNPAAPIHLSLEFVGLNPIPIEATIVGKAPADEIPD